MVRGLRAEISSRCELWEHNVGGNPLLPGLFPPPAPQTLEELGVHHASTSRRDRGRERRRQALESVCLAEADVAARAGGDLLGVAEVPEEDARGGT
jgi:hypothetical protein